MLAEIFHSYTMNSLKQRFYFFMINRYVKYPLLDTPEISHNSLMLKLLFNTLTISNLLFAVLMYGQFYHAFLC